MANLKKVTVIVPVRNEEKFIAQCLESIVKQDYPQDKMEIFVIDGLSEDNTRQVITEYADKYRNVKILNNPQKIVPTALNIGIKQATGEIIVRVDARCWLEPGYISECVKYLEKTGADCVGGPMRPVGDNFFGKAVSFAHDCWFGLGGAKFHNPSYEGYVDTVYLGAYPKRIFERVGLFNEKLERNQDIEFNYRLRKQEGKIFMTPRIKSFYYCRSSLKDLWKQNFSTGYWNIKTIRISPGSLSLRHFVPLFFVLGLGISAILSPFVFLGKLLLGIILISYLLLSILFSIKIGLQNGIKYAFIMPVVFLTLHLSYGFGSCWGIVKREPVRG